MATKRIFSEDEILWLKANYSITKNEVICERLGIGRTLLNGVSRQLGLKKIPTFQSDFVKVTKKYNDGRSKNRPSPLAIANSKAAIARLRQDEERNARWRENISKGLRELCKAEKRRVMFGLEQKTKRKVTKSPRFKYEHRCRMRSLGYIIDRGGNIAYYTNETKRNETKENTARKYGIRIEPLV